MIERDTLSRELSDLQRARASLDKLVPLDRFREIWNKIHSLDRLFDISTIEAPYNPEGKGNLMAGCYKSLDPEVRKKIAEQVDIHFRRITGYVGKLPSFSNARTEKERNLIRTWLRFRDHIIAGKLEDLCPQHFEIARIIIAMLRSEKLRSEKKFKTEPLNPGSK